jgi:cbb3-type cytochrome oxidase subunit 3
MDEMNELGMAEKIFLVFCAMLLCGLFALFDYQGRKECDKAAENIVNILISKEQEGRSIKHEGKN